MAVVDLRFCDGPPTALHNLVSLVLSG